MDRKEKHEKFLYPVVRVIGEEGKGSGTVIHSAPDPRRPDEYMTFVLTNHHVIKGNIKYDDEFNSVLKRKVDTEVIEAAKVQTFHYARLSNIDGEIGSPAEIIAYDTQHDLAVLKLERESQWPYVAELLPKNQMRELYLFDEIAVSGCSMAHDPFVTYGQLTYMNEKLEGGKRFFMYNAGSYFGNSGGALFHVDTGCLIGVPSRLTGVQLGFSVDMVLHMGFAAPIDRIYEFLEEQQLNFLAGDLDDDYYQALERRSRKRDDALMALKAEMVRQEATSKTSRPGGEALGE